MSAGRPLRDLMKTVKGLVTLTCTTLAEPGIFSVRTIPRVEGSYEGTLSGEERARSSRITIALAEYTNERF